MQLYERDVAKATDKWRTVFAASALELDMYVY